MKRPSISKTKHRIFSTIIFDFGGVISMHGNFGPLLKHLSKKHGVDFKSLSEILLRHWVEARVNTKKDRAFWRALANFLRISGAQVRKEILAFDKIRPGIIPLVKKLKKNYKTALLSNHIVGWLGVHLKRHALFRIFDIIVPSYDAKFAKPHMNIYKITLRKLGKPASQCIFIDDLERNLEPARKLGIMTVHFKNLTQCKRELKKLGVHIHL